MGPVRDHRRPTGGSPGSWVTTRSRRPFRVKRASEGFPPMVEKATTSTVVSAPSGERARNREPLTSRRDGALPPVSLIRMIWPEWGAAMASMTRNTGIPVCFSGDMVGVCLGDGDVRPGAPTPL